MTYANKYGRYGIYTDGMLLKWFKDIANACKKWDEMFANPDCVEEWLEEYDDVELVDMRTGDIIKSL
jgi:hypothetical protein